MSEGSMDQVLAGEATWCVIEGDCLEVMAGMADGCVDHVITDPPYEAEAHTKGRRLRTSGGVIVDPISFPPITEEQREACKERFGSVAGRWWLVFCQSEAVGRWISMGYRRTCVWTKPDAGPQLSGDRPGVGFEMIVCHHRPGRSRWNGGGRAGVFAQNKCGPWRQSGHQTEKPLPLFEKLVDLFTDPGDLILDPFAGSGTTGAAALRRGRRVILIEREPKWAELCRERLRAEEQQSDLRSARAGQVALFGGAE